MKLGIDIDGVLAKLVDALIPLVNEKYGLQLRKADIRQYDFRIGEIVLKEEIDEALRDEGFLLGLQIEEGAKEDLRLLGEEHKIVIVTGRPKDVIPATLKWLWKNGIGIDDLVVSTDKSRVDVDLLIDDNPEAVRKFIATGRPGYVFTQPWNKDLPRVDSWQQMLEVCLDESMRQRGGG